MPTALHVLRITLGLIILTAPPISLAYQSGDILFRAGPALVEPNEDSDASGTPAVLSGDIAGVDNGMAVGFTGVYMLTNHIGLELLAATPFEHDIKGKGPIAGVDVGSVKHLPPTLSVQYYFGGKEASIQPYLGVGLNYTTFFEEDADPEIEAAVGADVDIELDDSTGLALQAGIDWKVADGWIINAAIWHIDIESEANIKAPGSLLGDIDTDIDVDIDPMVYMIGVGRKF